ncbi:MazG-like family protein [Roseivivax isoporae]|uniref:Uncharacterized protein n=1 Tax=Roseivivax isoporae LMG 25204 TaxID=1449351 RepID=X7F6W1_9RHOB|nr:MazG nucleotide pyrophosphohydrolase domain-containing protein [Roseivivax isoporae]ETX28647.1 hypothetical protein RISW2_06005 [Roseivivax isoporae LMG 25204]
MTTAHDPVADFLDAHGLNCRIEERLLDISSELGEVSKEALKSSGYGNRPTVVSDDMAEEIADLLFSVHALAVEAGHSPADLLEKAIRKYERRMADKGDAGSGR